MLIVFLILIVYFFCFDDPPKTIRNFLSFDILNPFRMNNRLNTHNKKNAWKQKCFKRIIIKKFLGTGTVVIYHITLVPMFGSQAVVFIHLWMPLNFTTRFGLRLRYVPRWDQRNLQTPWCLARSVRKFGSWILWAPDRISSPLMNMSYELEYLGLNGSGIV